MYRDRQPEHLERERAREREGGEGEEYVIDVNVVSLTSSHSGDEE